MRYLKLLAPVVVSLLAGCSSSTGAHPAPMRASAPSLRNLYAAHPRLFVHRDQLPALRQAIAADPVLADWHRRLAEKAQSFFDTEPVRWEGDSRRTSHLPHPAMERITVLAGLYLLDGDRQYAERARRELLAIAAFPDWNPPHFLDVAEMTAAAGIGYDWLYDYLSPQDRATIRDAIVRLGLRASINDIRRNAAWTRVDNNWAHVCNGGLIVGALAIADERPGIAEEILDRCGSLLRNAMRLYGRDGSSPEGPNYWAYGTLYDVQCMAALQTALGDDMGLSQSPGFDNAGFFRLFTVGPTGKNFDYADSRENPGRAPQLFWMASRYNQPAYAREVANMLDNVGMFHLLWGAMLAQQRPGILSNPPAPPLDYQFPSAAVAAFRSSWNPDALYLAIKGGDNGASHAHHDLGTFVLDAFGQRWAADLGAADYALPGYSGQHRFRYFRPSTEAHNTLLIDGRGQSPDARASITFFTSTPDNARVVIDLTSGYRDRASRILRGVAMIDRSAILIQDEIRSSAPITWNMLTPAQVQIQGQRATLTQGDKQLIVQVLSPPDARLAAVIPQILPPEQGLTDMRYLRITVARASAPLAILIAPPDRVPQVRLVPLAQWSAKGL